MAEGLSPSLDADRDQLLKQWIEARDNTGNFIIGEYIGGVFEIRLPDSEEKPYAIKIGDNPPDWQIISLDRGISTTLDAITINTLLELAELNKDNGKDL